MIFVLPMRLIQFSASSVACFAETAAHSQNEYFHLLMSFWFLVYPTDTLNFQNIFLGFSLALMLLSLHSLLFYCFLLFYVFIIFSKMFFHFYFSFPLCWRSEKRCRVHRSEAPSGHHVQKSFGYAIICMGVGNHESRGGSLCCGLQLVLRHTHSVARSAISRCR